MIEKTTTNNNTEVKISKLDENQSINEIAKLISGKDISKESIEHAKKLKACSE